jgi:hypothetical protein
VCKCVLPLGDNPIAVNKYIYHELALAEQKVSVFAHMQEEGAAENTGKEDVNTVSV